MSACLINDSITIGLVEDSCDDESAETIAEPNLRYFINLRKKPLKFLATIVYSCESCPFTTKHRVIYDNHLQAHASDAITVHKCVYCRNMYKGDLTRHLHICPKFKKYKCAYCSFKSHKRKLINNHFSQKHRGILSWKVAKEKLLQTTHVNNSGINLSNNGGKESRCVKQ